MRAPIFKVWLDVLVEAPHNPSAGIRRDFINQRSSVRRVGWGRPDRHQEVTHGIRAFLSALKTRFSADPIREEHHDLLSRLGANDHKQKRREDKHRSEGGSSELI